LETYSLKDVHAMANRVSDGPAEFTPPDQAVRLFSKLSGLWDTFREMGVFPPPKSYNGFKVVTPTEVMIPDASSPEGEKLSAADEASIAMVEHMLKRFVRAERAADAADEKSAESADATLQATSPDGQTVEVQAHAQLTPAAQMEGGQFRPSPGEAMETFFSQAGPLPRRAMELEIDVADEPAGDRVDGESAGRAVSVWGRDEQGHKRLLAFGREGQGAVYVGHQTPSDVEAAEPAAPPAAKPPGVGDLTPHEQAALGQLGQLDLAV
jgi:hypothetical protein